jgi:hypothetical protein
MLLSVYVYRKQCVLSSSSDRQENINPEEVAKKVKDAAKVIRETSSTARRVPTTTAITEQHNQIHFLSVWLLIPGVAVSYACSRSCP